MNWPPRRNHGPCGHSPAPARVLATWGSGGIGTVVHAPVTIHTALQLPHEIAGSFQRHVAEARNYRTHDMEPELT